MKEKSREEEEQPTWKFPYSNYKFHYDLHSRTSEKE